MATEQVGEITKILSAIGEGDPRATEDLFPIVYDELRRLASAHMAREAPGHTLQPTALVHEAYLRLLGNDGSGWENRRHFFAAAAEAMRRILVENARKKRRVRHGGEWKRVDLETIDVAVTSDADQLLAVHEALSRLEQEDPLGAELIKLRFFVGLSNLQAAAVLGIGERSAKRAWAYARAWLYEALKDRP